jgi:hypothetical protein
MFASQHFINKRIDHVMHGYIPVKAKHSERLFLSRLHPDRQLWPSHIPIPSIIYFTNFNIYEHRNKANLTRGNVNMLRSVRNTCLGLSLGLILGGLAVGATSYLSLGIAAGAVGLILEVINGGRL